MHHPKVKGLNPAPDTGREKVAKKFSCACFNCLCNCSSYKLTRQAVDSINQSIEWNIYDSYNLDIYELKTPKITLVIFFIGWSHCLISYMFLASKMQAMWLCNIPHKSFQHNDTQSNDTQCDENQCNDTRYNANAPVYCVTVFTGVLSVIVINEGPSFTRCQHLSQV